MYLTSVEVLWTKIAVVLPKGKRIRGKKNGDGRDWKGIFVGGMGWLIGFDTVTNRVCTVPLKRSLRQAQGRLCGTLQRAHWNTWAGGGI
jgi:hypothetical protein